MHGPCRDAGDAGLGRDVLRDDGTGGDECAGPDLDALEHDGAHPDVGPVADDRVAADGRSGSDAGVGADAAAVVLDDRAGVDDRALLPIAVPALTIAPASI